MPDPELLDPVEVVLVPHPPPSPSPSPSPPTGLRPGSPPIIMFLILFFLFVLIIASPWPEVDGPAEPEDGAAEAAASELDGSGEVEDGAAEGAKTLPCFSM